MILLTEYHASFIRLRRVVLLRSDIRLTPSDICFASFGSEYHCEAKPNNITIAAAIISLRRSWNITLVFSVDFCYNGIKESLSLRERWHEERDGRSLRDLGVLISFIATRSPSVSFATQPLPEGALGCAQP